MHHSRLFSASIDCTDLEKNVQFWSQALNRKVAHREGDNFVILESSPDGMAIALQSVPDTKSAKTRIHFDITTDNMDAEVARLEGLGATRQAKKDFWWIMQDPSGNEFCVVAYWIDTMVEHSNEWES